MPKIRRFPPNYGKRRLVPKNWDLGLAVLEATRTPGETFTHRQIAECCGVSYQAVYRVEQKALKKLRNAIFYQAQHRELRTSLKS